MVNMALKGSCYGHFGRSFLEGQREIKTVRSLGQLRSKMELIRKVSRYGRGCRPGS